MNEEDLWIIKNLKIQLHFHNCQKVWNEPATAISSNNRAWSSAKSYSLMNYYLVCNQHYQNFRLNLNITNFETLKLFIQQNDKLWKWTYYYISHQSGLTFTFAITAVVSGDEGVKCTVKCKRKTAIVSSFELK